MDTVAQEQGVSKLLAMTDNVVIHNQAYNRARRSHDGPRAYGKLNKSIKELAETAEHLRKKVSPP